MQTDASQTTPDRFERDRYVLRSQFLRIFGGAYRLYDDTGAVVLYAEMKRFRLKEDIRIYEDEAMQHERLRVSTQSIFDISGAYDVSDSRTGERVGTLQRSGLSSTFMRDHWRILDAAGEHVGDIQEDSILKALARRFVEFVALLLPQKYDVAVGGRPVASLQQRFNPLIYKLDVDFSADTARHFDRRLGLATAVLLAAIEGRQ